MTRDAWTDERLDDFSSRMDEGFRRVDERFNQVNERFHQVDERFSRVEQDLRDLRGEMSLRFDTTQRLIIQIGAGMLTTMIVGFISVLVALH